MIQNTTVMHNFILLKYLQNNTSIRLNVTQHKYLQHNNKNTTIMHNDTQHRYLQHNNTHYNHA
jgi:hypothetical protein